MSAAAARVAFEQHWFRPAMAAVSAYECAAIVSGRLPTVTALVQRLRRTRYGQIILWAAFGWVAVHFFEVEQALSDIVDGTGR